jgi:hypothetical protein
MDAARRPRKVRTISLLVGAVALPAIALAQPGRSLRDEALAELVQSIEQVRAEEGVHSSELIGPLTTLGLYYQEHGDPTLAIAAIEQARQVVRVNYGLYSLREAPLLQQWIDAEEARGNPQGAWDVEQRLLALVSRNPNDLRTVPILREIAQRRLDILDEYTDGGYPPQIVLGCYYSQYREGNCRSGSRGQVKEALLREALSYYFRAIDTVAITEGRSSARLPDLLTEVVRVAYAHGRGAIGRQALRYLHAYKVENDAPPVETIDALVQIADWDMLFARGERRLTQSAVDLYERAYAEADGAGIEQRSVDAIFSPRLPVVLPSFAPNPLATQESSETSGFIDVAFDITRNGESERIEVLDTTTNASEDARKRLVELIDDRRFRPIVTFGRVEETARVALRYYLND